MDAEKDSSVRVHIRVSGRVQGVGFRYFVQRLAVGSGVNGWVRNLRDRRVEMVAEADRETLENLVAAIRKGPPSSMVSGVDVAWGQASGEIKGFEIKMTV